MNKPLAVQSESRKVARPLKILIPMIQSELQQGNAAGREHYRMAGEMLIEAKDQVGHGGWGQWLAKNFDLSRSTASVYMEWARQVDLSRGERQNPLRDEISALLKENRLLRDMIATLATSHDEVSAVAGMNAEIEALRKN